MIGEKYCYLNSIKRKSTLLERAFFLLDYLPFGGLFPLPPPEGLPVVLGPFAGLEPFAMTFMFFVIPHLGAWISAVFRDTNRLF